MAKIFICYRREDSQWPTDRLHQALKSVVADPHRDIFIDIDNIPFGVDFEQYLGAQVGQCDILLAMIGRGWIDARDPGTGQRRLDDPKDFVRIEIATALARGIRVVPILVDGAIIPREDELPTGLQPLAKRNGMDLQRMTFDADIARLIRGLGLNEAPAGRKAAAKRSPRPPSNKLALWGWILLALSIPAVFAATSYLFAPRGEFDPEPDMSTGIALMILSQPILGWIGCTLVAKAASRRPYWLVVLLTFITSGPVGLVIWLTGANIASSGFAITPEAEGVAAVLISSLAALGAGLTALGVGSLIRKRTAPDPAH